MIRVNNGQGYVPRWFERELKLISPNFSVIWDGEAQSFLVVSPGPLSVFRKYFIPEYAVTDESGNYIPLDSNVLEAIREILYRKPKEVKVENGKQKIGPLIRKIKQRRLERREKAFREYLAMKADFYKKWGKLWKTKTFT